MEFRRGTRLEIEGGWMEGLSGLTVIGSIAAFRAVFRTVRRKMDVNRSGHCGNCDYDLTGNVSGTCPECGTPCTPGNHAEG
jgi:hypothetical protein